MDVDDEARTEAAVGARLREGRGDEPIRAVATRAGMSPTQWRHMENGVRDNGVRVRPSDKTLAAAAKAVGLDPAEVFALAGRTYDGSPVTGRPALEQDDRLTSLERRMDGLEEAVTELRSQRQ